MKKAIALIIFLINFLILFGMAYGIVKPEIETGAVILHIITIFGSVFYFLHLDDLL